MVRGFSIYTRNDVMFTEQTQSHTSGLPYVRVAHVHVHPVRFRFRVNSSSVVVRSDRRTESIITSIGPFATTSDHLARYTRPGKTTRFLFNGCYNARVCTVS